MNQSGTENSGIVRNMNKDRTILIVEDEEINQLIISEILKEYNLIHAYNGREAMEIIKARPEELSLVLLDLVMPEMGGMEVLAEMKKDPEVKDLPVVIISGYPEKEGETLQLGALDFWQKPYAEPVVLQNRTRNLINFSESARIIKSESHDEVTGLLNMRQFLSESEKIRQQDIQAAGEADKALVFVDLANFKAYNFNHGIAGGDECLRKVAEILKYVFPGDLISRFAEDHFVLATFSEGLEERLEQASELIKRLGAGVHLHLKAGIRHTQKEDAKLDMAVLCDQAKMACDLLVNESDQYIMVYDPRINEERARRQYIIDHVDWAIENEHIKVYLQPVIRALSGYLCGAEALVRWIDPNLGFLSPGEFIPVLEEAQLIHKVDSYVIRKICQSYRRRVDNNEPVVPVSFNLSRLDFVLTDIRQVIVDAVTEHRVPKNMLNVEITESLFVKDATHIHTEIEKLKELGLQVWMDDFGSGYSSLNVLKDYEFDELKIDMAFLTSFTDKSKEILKSIVRMAKDIGIQTLAEGVETREQYEFLRNIGCEKIQGYYFGKPEPGEVALENCVERGIKVETRAWADYYDKIGKINLLDERPIAIIEDDGENARFVFANEAYMESLESNGTMTLEAAAENLNSHGTPMRNLLRRFMESILRSGKYEEITYPSGTQYMSLGAQLLASCNGYNMFLTELTNVTRNTNEEKQNEHDSIVRNVLYLYDEVSEIDLETGTLHAFDTMSDDGDLARMDEVQSLEAFMPQFTERIIYGEDQDRFRQFTDFSTVRERMMASEDGSLSSYFRCKEPDGNYHWRVHTLMAVPKSDYRRMLVISRKVPLDDVRVQDYLFQMHEKAHGHRQGSEFSEEEIRAISLWENMMNFSEVKYFWKDTNRRFLGASRAFLNYYDIELTDILGKTDEDMSWHISDGPYMNDELKVLNEGARIVNAAGQCIIKGVVHNIFANKIPIYRDGKIEGLLGYFIDADSAVLEGKQTDSIMTVDVVTRLSNARGIMESFMYYSNEYKDHQKDFVAIGIDVEGYREFRGSFGEEAGDTLLKELASIVKRHFKMDAAIGRLQGSKFMVFYQRTNPTYLQTLLDQVKEEIAGITSVSGYPCTCFPHVITANATSPQRLEEAMAAFWATAE